MRKLRWLGASVQKLVKGLRQQGQRLVREVVLGMVLGGSTILCEIARNLYPDKRSFEACIERLSRDLGNPRCEVWYAAGEYLHDAGRETWRDYGFIPVDITEIVKPYGRVMQFLTTVRDGSRSGRGEAFLARGWWVIDICATTDDHRVLPLFRHVWSDRHPQHLSENEELRQAVAFVRPHVNPQAIWVMDRGGDATHVMNILETEKLRWAIRMRGDRHARRVGSDDGPRAMSELARAMAKPHAVNCWVSHRNQLTPQKRYFGYSTVQLTEGGPYRWLIAVERAQYLEDDRLPLMLLTSVPIRGAATAARIVRGYSRRWSVEDDTRACKQLIDLEDVRVLRWKALVDLVMLTTVAQGLVALQEARAPRRAARLAAQAPIVDPIPPYRIYRLWMTVAYELREALVALRGWRRAWLVGRSSRPRREAMLVAG